MQEIKIKLVKDYMKKRVVKFSPEDSIFKVAKVLSKKHISGGPVVKKGKLVGVISESDIIKFMQLKFPGTSSLQEPHMLSLVIANLIKDQLKFKKELERISKVKVADIMTKDPITISPNDTLIEAATRMAKYDVQRLIVVKKDKVIGIITRADLLKALLE